MKTESHVAQSAHADQHTTAAAPADQPTGGASAMSRHPCPPPPSPDAFTVSVKTLDGRSLQVDVSPRTLVIEVKAELAARLGREACELELVFAGARLDDTMQLEAYGMKLATTIHLVWRPPCLSADPAMAAKKTTQDDLWGWTLAADARHTLCSSRLQSINCF